MTYKIYVDMDGVLTNFNKQASAYLNVPENEVDNQFINNPNKTWKIINKAGKDFWANMEWLPEGKTLWNYLKKYNPIILSAPSAHHSSIEGKKEWIEKHIPNTYYILEQNKEKYADKNSILIDDREDNIKKWRDNNGIGILYKNNKDTIKQLEKIMQDENTNKEGYMMFPVSNKLKEILAMEELKDIVPRTEQVKEIKMSPWYSRDERLEIINKVFDSILRRLTGIHIPRDKLAEIEKIQNKIKKISLSEYTPSETEAIKKELVSKAFHIDITLAELINLLFKQVTNNQELRKVTEEMKKKALPYIAAPKKKSPTDDYYISPVFREMLKRAQIKAATIDLSKIPFNIAEELKICIKKLMEL